ncbi:hypothetical protein [Streptomyces sp. NPDC018036]|uniref:hypothetical protein n=1 Tax=Streptomyces sp. NPDC018036 TaxID=3365035 RepID=UPI00378C01EA
MGRSSQPTRSALIGDAPDVGMDAIRGDRAARATLRAATAQAALTAASAQAVLPAATAPAAPTATAASTASTA